MFYENPCLGNWTIAISKIVQVSMIPCLCSDGDKPAPSLTVYHCQNC